ncbi:MFS transporter [Chelatococcus asaccharovorans]|uniref:MFS transporter n=1 Tax=Chelatococcus asaccharovorans TaxID=28210 RepID=UPI00224C70AE|nr:MFS transporter [Chelatococcus asaccharovorans]CAH1668497.1 putative MFS family arabinose efflux permease [Chelatococcus asaccharovorans]CAH1680066.1 putative MFS family arabinose efflux permease [Chelatococcus asaccharovorans]
MTEKISPLAPFRHETFRAIWTANLASNFGSLIQGVGAAWMMTTISDSADMVALVQASAALPIMLFSIAAGAIADNFNRRDVMLTAQSLMFIVSIGLAVTTYLGVITPWLLLAFTFLIGCGTALNNPSWQAAVGDMVPRDDLPAAVALNSMGFNLTRSVGPAIGGAIVAAGGAAAAFTVNAMSYLALIVVLWRWDLKRPASTLPRETIGSAIGAGLRYVAMSPNIEKVLLRACVFGFTVISVVALLPLVARDIVRGGPLLYGIFLGAFGVGAVGGALIAEWLRQTLSAEIRIRLAFTGFAVCAFTIALSTEAWLTGAALLIGGMSWVTAFSLFNVAVQLSTPRWVVGRALSLYQTASFGGMALGSWIWGTVAQQSGPATALIIASALMLVGAALGLKRLGLPEQTALNLDPLNSWKEPHLALDLLPRSGPIVIIIEYVIKDENLPAFLSAMAERRRIRRRDGARYWTLTRSLEKPDIWWESYQTPTWIDYIRHNQRITKADAAVGERLRALHDGPERPKVHRMIERSPEWPPRTAPGKEMIDLHQ